MNIDIEPVRRAVMRVVKRWDMGPEAAAAVIEAVNRGLAAASQGDEGLREDAEKWRAAEAEGHIVDFSDSGYGLQHPPSCRPDLIGCPINVYLASLDEPDMPPGRYRITDGPEYAALDAEEERG